MLYDFLIPFLIVALAELGDKTHLCVFLLSSKVKNHFLFILGVMLAYFLVDGIAILFGTIASNFLPNKILKIVSGFIFIVFGLFYILEKEGCKNEKSKTNNPFLIGFSFIFISEWGDKTQISSGLLATQYNWLLVLLGTLSALFLISLTSIYLGKIITKRIEANILSKISGIIFLIIGISLFSLP